MTLVTLSKMSGEADDTSRDMSQKERRKSASKQEEETSKLELERRGDNKEENGGSQSNTAKQSNELPVTSESEIPLVKIHRATPSPRPASQSEDAEEEKKSKKKKQNEEGDEDAVDEEDEFDDDDDEEEEEDVEEEQKEREMTQDEKKTMYEAVIDGDIDVLEDCLDLSNADINMVWFQENLLMAAVRTGHVDVCEFLLDNGVDYTFSTSVVDVHDTPTGKVLERYEVDCRQMAYDRDLQDVVFLIDVLQDNLFPFIPRPLRTPRLRRPKPESSDDVNSDDDDDDDADDEDQNSSFSDVTDTSLDLDKKEEQQNISGTPAPDGENRKRKKNKKKAHRKKQSRTNSAVAEDEGVKGVNSDNNDDDGKKKTATIDDYDNADDDDDEEKDRTFRTDAADSGNYSMASSKLKRSMVKRHNRLYENQERGGSGSLDSARKSKGESAQTKTTKSQQSKYSKGDKSDRTSSTTSTGQGEGQSRSGGQTESVTPTLITAVPEIPKWAAVLMNPPKNRIRSNRAALATRQGNLTGNFYKTPLHTSSLERPLQWRKISATGSYARESRRWHLEKRIQEAATESIQISQLKLTPLSPPSSKMVSLAQTTSSSFSSPKSHKSQPPSPPSTSPSDVLESVSSSSILSIADRIDRLKAQKSIPSRQDASSSPVQQSPTPKVASYMRPTQSTITKNRLGPQFVDSYGGLDFQAQPTKSANFKPGILKYAPKKDQVTTNSSSLKNVMSRSYKVPALTAKTVSQRRNQNVISYRV